MKIKYVQLESQAFFTDLDPLVRGFDAPVQPDEE